MAKAVALSLASGISARFGMNQVNFFTGNLILATFLNGNHLEPPPTGGSSLILRALSMMVRLEPSGSSKLIEDH